MRNQHPDWKPQICTQGDGRFTGKQVLSNFFFFFFSCLGNKSESPSSSPCCARRDAGTDPTTNRPEQARQTIKKKKKKKQKTKKKKKKSKPTNPDKVVRVVLHDKPLLTRLDDVVMSNCRYLSFVVLRRQDDNQSRKSNSKD
jgi:hypothetical protein